MSKAKHIIILDAGSTGSRIHIISYHSAASVGHYPHLSLSGVFAQVNPGLASFADNPSEAGAQLRPLINLARLQIPDELRAGTPLRLMATAGLRMLPEAASHAILDSCRQELFLAGFTQASTAVISGVQEGLYAWLAVNYINNALPQVSVRQRPGSSRQECFHSETYSFWGNRKAMLPEPGQEPMSVAEMGGASLQITIAGGQLPAGAACDDLFAPIALPRTPLDGCSLLTHSFMGFGREEAFKRVSATGAATAAHCSHQDYEYAPGQFGAGQFELCAAAITSTLFQADGPVAADGGPCPCGSCDGSTRVPQIGFGGRLMATENFARAVAGLQLREDASLRELREAGARHCAMPWETVAQALPPNTEPADAAKLCFTAAYTVVFMQQVLSVGLDDRRIHFANSLTVQGQQQVHLDWPLGAALEYLVAAEAESASAEDGAGVGPLADTDRPSAPWEIPAVAFWLVLAALLMACLTWIRVLFPGRCAGLTVRLTRWWARLRSSTPSSFTPDAAQGRRAFGMEGVPSMLPEFLQQAAGKFLYANPKAKRSQDLAPW